MNRRKWIQCAAAAALANQMTPQKSRARQAAPPEGALFVHARDFVGQSGLDGVFEIDLANNTWTQIAIDEGRPFNLVSPNGTWLALASTGAPNDRARGIWVRSVDPADEPKHVCELYGRAHWYRDDNQLLISAERAGDDGQAPLGSHDHWLIDRDGKHRKQLPLPNDCAVVAVSPDGSHVILQQLDPNADPATFFHPLSVATIQGTRRVPLVPQNVRAAFPRFSPGGNRVLYYRYDGELDGSGDVNELSIEVVEWATGNTKRIVSEQNDLGPFNAVWSPNGQQLAVMLWNRARKEGKKNEIVRDCRVAICDLETKHLEFLPFERARSPLILLGWSPPRPAEP